VSAQWQRRGIGRELLNFVLKLARDYGAKMIYLEVRPSNAAAVALYASAGFAGIALRRSYYPAGDTREDAVVMQLELDKK
jgi:ribosomal-protein-alanine N-acetyltransferase